MTLIGVFNFTARLLVYLTVLFSCSAAIKYNIWFKYPQPYNPSEPSTYCKENVTSVQNCSSQIPIYVNTLDSEKTYVPYSYNQFDFCPSIEGFEYSESDLVEWDDKIFRTSYDMKFLNNEQCKLLCKKSYDLSRIFDIHRISVLKMLMSKQYYQHWFADNFPMSWCHSQNPLECYVGVPVGYYVDQHGNPNDPRIKKRTDTKADTFYLFNHLDFTFIYETGTAKPWGDNIGDKIGRITAIKISPRSIKHEKSNFKNCALDSPLLDISNAINYSSTVNVYHSYSITFIRDDSTDTETRWPNLLSTLPDSNYGKWHIITAILLVIILSFPFVFVLSRTLLTKHELFGWINGKPLSSPTSGWQAIASDVFRAPKYPFAFAALIGSGVQYIFCLGVVEVLTLLVHFSTSLVLLVLIAISLILLVGCTGGYVAARFYKSFGGENWKYNCLLTASFNPIMLTALLFLTRNFLLLESASSVAFPIGLTAAVFIVLICYGLALPLTFAGAYFGFSYQLPIEYPVRPTANTREIPKQLFYNTFPFSLILGGIIPFMAIWIIENYPYFNSGEFLITTASILICAETAVIFCYSHLYAEEYRWWWRSYLTIGFAAVYYLMHCLCVIVTTLVIDDLLSALLYGLFSLMLSVLLFSMIGTIGFLVSLTFIWMTYTLNKPIAEIDYSTFPEAT